jgi:putative endonuclease
MSNSYFIYIISNEKLKPIYTGVTNNLIRRIYEHKKELNDSFSKKYKIKNLLYFEETNDINLAINREKQFKNWHRDWKINIIKTKNPYFCDLSKDWF